MTGGLKAHVLVGDKEVCSVTTLGEQSGHTEFNCLLGKLTKGTVIYVAITGNGNAAYGSFRMDFSVGTGLQAAIQSSTEHRATMTDVEDELAFDTADFRADFANNGFSYMLNKGKLTEPTKFVPLKNVAGGPCVKPFANTLPDGVNWKDLECWSCPVKPHLVPLCKLCLCRDHHRLWPRA